MVPVLILGDARGIRSVGHVDGDGRVGVKPEGGPACAVEPYLLLHAGHRHDLGADVLLFEEQPQSLQHHEGTHAVVYGAGSQAPVRELHQVLVDHADVADADHALRLLGIFGADVDPEALYLGDLLALFWLHDVDGLLADHADDLAAVGEQPDALPHEDLRIPAAHACKSEHAAILDVGDHHSYLVDVSREHDLRLPPRAYRGKRVAHPVPAHLGEFRRFLPPDPGGGLLVTTRSRGREQPLQEDVRCVPHAGPFYAKRESMQAPFGALVRLS